MCENVKVLRAKQSAFLISPFLQTSYLLHLSPVNDTKVPSCILCKWEDIYIKSNCSVLYPTLEVACVPASVEAAERVARAVDVGLAHAPAVGLHAVARGQVRQAVHRRAAPTGHVVVVVVVGKSDGETYLGHFYGGSSLF